jgi:undecaprenyl-diphosphatase
MRHAIGSLNFFDRISALEVPLCRFCHRQANAGVLRFFATISKIGDGHYLYATLAALLWIDGLLALPTALRAIAAAAACHVLYRWLKNGTARVRPFELLDDLVPHVPALDKYSFPSGHTCHAVAFAWVAVAGYGWLGLLLIPFACLVALSRVVLGLHFPTDVVAGAALGSTVALAALAI